MIAKLRAYGLSNEAVSLLQNYLSGRMQRVRVGSHISSWKDLSKGVINDIFYFVLKSVL